MLSGLFLLENSPDALESRESHLPKTRLCPAGSFPRCLEGSRLLQPGSDNVILTSVPNRSYALKMKISCTTSFNKKGDEFNEQVPQTAKAEVTIGKGKTLSPKWPSVGKG